MSLQEAPHQLWLSSFQEERGEGSAGSSAFALRGRWLNSAAKLIRDRELCTIQAENSVSKIAKAENGLGHM